MKRFELNEPWLNRLGEGSRALLNVKRPLNAPTHPRVEALIRWLKRAALIDLMVVVSMGLVCFIISALQPGRSFGNFHDVFEAAMGHGFSVLIILLVLFVLLYISLVTIYFVKISLLQLITMVWLIGLFIAFAISVHDEFKFFPIIMIPVIVLSMGYEAIRQDPTGERHVPGFVRRQMVEKIRARIRKRRADQARVSK